MQSYKCADLKKNVILAYDCLLSKLLTDGVALGLSLGLFA